MESLLYPYWGTSVKGVESLIYPYCGSSVKGVESLIYPYYGTSVKGGGVPQIGVLRGGSFYILFVVY